MPLPLSLFLLAAAAPQAVAPPATAETTPVAASTPLLHDSRGRPVIRVRIDDREDVPMVVDTAAQASLIAAPFAAELGLTPQAGGIRVAGATGVAAAAIYSVRRIASPLFDWRNVTLIALPNATVTEAKGILGINAFRQRRLVFDRTNASLQTLPSAAAPEGYATIAGRSTAEGFVEIPMTLNGVAVAALVDTGAAVTVANPAALRALGWRADDPRLADGGEIRGAASTTQGIRMATLDHVGIGRIGLSRVPIFFSVAPDGDDHPSIILGNDLLRLFEAFAVDLTRAELQIRIPAG